MKTIIEPFRIKSVEPIRKTRRAEREQILRDAGLSHRAADKIARVWNLANVNEPVAQVEQLTKQRRRHRIGQVRDHGLLKMPMASRASAFLAPFPRTRQGQGKLMGH